MLYDDVQQIQLALYKAQWCAPLNAGVNCLIRLKAVNLSNN